jgi:hypothetical protein
MGGEEVSANENNQRDIRKTANLDIWCVKVLPELKNTKGL